MENSSDGDTLLLSYPDVTKNWLAPSGARFLSPAKPPSSCFTRLPARETKSQPAILAGEKGMQMQ
jgi:hypothetical protein